MLNGIKGSCTRLYEARGAIWSETKNTLTSGHGVKAKAENKADLANLHKKDIVMLALVLAILAAGIAVLSFYGINVMSGLEDVEHIAPMILLGLTTVASALTAGFIVPDVAMHLLEKIDEERQEFRELHPDIV